MITETLIGIVVIALIAVLYILKETFGGENGKSVMPNELKGFR